MSSSSSAVVKTADLVIVDWKDLLVVDDENKSIREAIQKAYGRSGTGILAIRNVPGFVNAKQAFLPLAHTLATQLPTDYLENELTDATSLYNAGWSHGKEKLGADNKPPDTAKGSFYYNPVTDSPGTEAERAAYPLSYPCNVWPTTTAIPGFQEKAVTIGLILKQAAVAVARHLDALVVEAAAEQRTAVANPLLYDALKDSVKVKCRLLYYFPLPENDNEKAPSEAAEDSWIGWHNDSGFLTALAGDLYVNHTTGAPVESCPDAAAGLYVVDRCSSGNILKVDIPSDCLAVQVGECTEILTGGAVQATPHCVRGCRRQYPDIARISLPCFVDTPPTFRLQMPAYCTREQVLAAACTDKVPPLAARWESDGMTFGDFLQKTFSMYYEWNAS